MPDTRERSTCIVSASAYDACFHCTNRSLYHIYHKCTCYPGLALRGKDYNVVIKRDNQSSQRYTNHPERLVKQYLAYCEETGFKALSRSTLLRILSVCAASVRKSLQGLDYISSSGAGAFDDLCKVAEMLGDAGQGMGWAKQQETNLRESKRYLKSDYKVRFINLFV